MSFKPRICSVLVGALVGLLVLSLYLPFSGSPLVFDDLSLQESAYDFAQNIFARFPRTFPYFSIGFVHVLSGGDFAWNRYFGAVLHCAVVLALYFFLSRALTRIPADTSRRWVAAIVCLWVALNPVAVYAVAYLVQRTIVFAALFGILSANLYLRAQQRERNADLFSAALFAGLAVMSKEHAVLLPLAAVALTPLVCDWDRAAIRRAAGYLLLSLPCAVWALVNRGADIVGTSYEVFSGEVLAQFVLPEIFDFSGGRWAMSIATQLLLFWNYLLLWLFPNPQWMSADLRVDFLPLWSGGWALVGLLASMLAFFGAAVVWLRSGTRNRIAQVSAALLFAAIPFLVELSVVRVQEPFVLYRSYLWMPAYALLLALALCWGAGWVGRCGVLWRRLYWGGLVLACAALFPLAQDRLRSFSSEEALWQDALHKLSRPDVPGADRIYYNLAGEAYKRKDFIEALRFSEKTITQNPSAFHGYLAKGTSLLALRDFDAALRVFDEAGAHQPPPNFLGYIEFKRCAVFDARGDRSATIACLKRSASMGYEMARFRLQMAGIAD